MLASKIVLLDEVQQKEAASMIIRVRLDKFYEDTLPHLRELLEQNRGECELAFELNRDDYSVVVRPHPFLRVEPSSELVTSLKAICGENAVQLSRVRLTSSA